MFSSELLYILPCGEWASIWQRAERLSLDVAFLFPFLEVSESSQFGWVLHPLDNLLPKR